VRRQQTYVEHVANESVSDDSNGALPQGGAVEIVLGVEGAAQHGEADQCVEVEYDEAKYSHPQQRLACMQTTIDQTISYLLDKSKQFMTESLRK